MMEQGDVTSPWMEKKVKNDFFLFPMTSRSIALIKVMIEVNAAMRVVLYFLVLKFCHLCSNNNSKTV